MPTTTLPRKARAVQGLRLTLMLRHLDDPSGGAGRVAAILRRHGGNLPGVILLSYLERESMTEAEAYAFLLDATDEEPKRFKWSAL